MRVCSSPWHAIEYLPLQEAAHKIVNDLHGILPKTAAELEKQLPGVGRYTAGNEPSLRKTLQRRLLMQAQSHRLHTMKLPLWYVNIYSEKSTILMKFNSLTATYIEYFRASLRCMLTRLRKPPHSSCGRAQMEWWIQTGLATSIRL